MLRHSYEVFEQAACTLARSAQPIQQRLSLACAVMGKLRSDDFGNYQELRDTFDKLTELLLRKEPSGDLVPIDFSRLSDEQAEQLAADVFDAFVFIAEIHLTTRH